MYRAVGSIEELSESFDQLRSSVLVAQGCLSTFITCASLKVGAMLGVVDEDVKDATVVQPSHIVQDVCLELEEIDEELIILQESIILLLRIGLDKGSRLLMKSRVSVENDRFQGTMAVTLARANDSRVSTILGEHIGPHEDLIETFGSLESANLEMSRQIVVSGITTSKPGNATMVRTETP